MIRRLNFLVVVFAAILFSTVSYAADAGAYPIALSEYPEVKGMWDTILERAMYAPFNIFASIIFLLAIIHTFCHQYFTNISHNLKRKQAIKVSYGSRGRYFISSNQKQPASFQAELFHLLGEVEAIFALWLIPLFIGFIAVYGWNDLAAYIDKLTFTDKKYIEPVFVVVIMCIAGTRPIIQLSSDIINKFAKIGKGSIKAWWISILCVGPLLGSFITEPAAITICATLLADKFYDYKPSLKFKYATIGLLLVAISAGGTLTHFSAPPVLMVASQWGWDMPFMFEHFGWKAVIGILISVSFYAFLFRNEFKQLQAKADSKKVMSSKSNRVPIKIVCVHFAFLLFTVVSLHHPALFIFAFLLFLFFVSATHQYQYDFKLKTPLLVGIFLAALVTHGTLQGWWIEPVLVSLSENELFVGSIVLTAFNDNAAITYLASLVDDFSATMQYMVVAGAVTGGGLTIIANAPNPAGAAILNKFFSAGISPKNLFLSSLIPTIIIAAAFYFL